MEFHGAEERGFLEPIPFGSALQFKFLGFGHFGSLLDEISGDMNSLSSRP